MQSVGLSAQTSVLSGVCTLNFVGNCEQNCSTKTYKLHSNITFVQILAKVYIVTFLNVVLIVSESPYEVNVVLIASEASHLMKSM